MHSMLAEKHHCKTEGEKGKILLGYFVYLRCDKKEFIYIAR